MAPVLIIMFATCGSAIYQAQEADANSYRTLRNAFKQGTPTFKYSVATAISDGKITRWDYAGLLRQYWQESTGLVLPTGATTVAEERVVLAAMARQARAPH